MTTQITERKKLSYYTFICDNCLGTLKRKVESSNISNRHMFCDKKWQEEYYETHEVKIIRDDDMWLDTWTMEAPIKCQLEMKISRCDQCTKPADKCKG